MADTTAVKTKGKLFDRMLNVVERAGNKMMDPITLFVILCIVTVALSAIVSVAGVTVTHPGTGEAITAVNLLSREGIIKMWTGAVSNFQNFPPFGMVMVALIGVGLAEKSGLLSVTMRRTLSNVPEKLVTVVIVFVGVVGNVAGDAAFVVLPPLAAMIYLGIGRNPLIGLFTAYGAVAGGFVATLFIALGDVLAYGFTVQAAQMIDPNYIGSPAMNYYFMIASTVIITVVGTIVSEKLIAPRFGEYDRSQMSIEQDPSNFKAEITPLERRGLMGAGITALICVGGLVFCSVGKNALLAHPDTGSILTGGSPFMSGIIISVTMIFFFPALVFGILSKTIKNDKDVVSMIVSSFKDMSSYILLAFVCAQFTAYFGWSNLGVILAIKGADFLQGVGLAGIPLLVCFILVSAVINIFIGSASAKWAIMAPIFVPMLMVMGFDPAVTQMAYRIGDSITNPITPLFSYFPILLGFLRRYDKKAGMGTIIANMLPFSLVFAVVWIIFFVLYVMTGLPLGPEGFIYYTMK